MNHALQNSYLQKTEEYTNPNPKCGWGEPKFEVKQPWQKYKILSKWAVALQSKHLDIVNDEQIKYIQMEEWAKHKNINYCHQSTTRGLFKAQAPLFFLTKQALQNYILNCILAPTYIASVPESSRDSGTRSWRTSCAVSRCCSRKARGVVLGRALKTERSWWDIEKSWMDHCVWYSTPFLICCDLGINDDDWGSGVHWLPSSFWAHSNRYVGIISSHLWLIIFLRISSHR